MDRTTAIWFVIAGVLAVGRWSLEILDIQYYDPQGLLDYSGVILQTAAGVATGVALILLWRDPPVSRGAWLLLLAGALAATQGVGNLLEDAFGVEDAVWLFFVGGAGMIFTLAAAGGSALSVRSELRWSGVFLLLGAAGGMLGPGLAVMGAAWIAFGVWLMRQGSTLHITSPHAPQHR